MILLSIPRKLTEMKPFIKIVLIVVLCFSLTTCCPKVNCLGSNEIQFYNFSQSEMNLITIHTYKSNTNLSTLVDSLSQRIPGPASVNGNTYYTGFLTTEIDGNYDYKIKIVSTGQNFVVDHFEKVKATCNECFPFGHDTFDTVGNYQINGKPATGNAIRIYKR